MKNTILSNISFNLLIRLITYSFIFLAMVYATRVFQPEAFGRISFITSIVGYFAILANFGMPNYAMRTCAGERSERKKLSTVCNELLSISVLLGFISFALLMTTAFFIPRLRREWLLILILGSAIIINAFNCEWLYRGLEKFRFLALVSFISKAISLIGIVLFVKSEEQIFLFAGLSVFSNCCMSILCFVMLHHYVDIDYKISINKAHIRPLMIFFMMSCAVYVYGSSDMTMLGFLTSDYETGLYSIAVNGKTVLIMTGGLVWSSILPTATNLWKEGKKNEFQSLASKSLLIVCGIQLLITIVCLIFASKIICMVCGEEYLGAVPAFRILLLSLVPIGASNIIGGQVLMPTGKEKLLLKAEIISAIFNFIANIALIPILSINGAAITTVISEVIVWSLCMYYAKNDLSMDLGLGLIMKVFDKNNSS